MKYNPFRPNSLVTISQFQGRNEEIQFVKQSLFQTKNGNPQHFLFEGERGLGKSSLFLIIENIALGNIPFFENLYLNFIVINVELDSSQSFFDILKAIAVDFKRSLSEKEKVKSLANNVWEFLTNWEILGVKYHKEDNLLIQPYEILNQLVNNFEKIIKQAKTEIDGILILIDEADRPPIKSSLGEIVKLITEKLTKRNCDKVLLGITGQPDVLEKLRSSHESAARIFTIINLKPLTEIEINAVIFNSLEMANSINKNETTITNEAIEMIIQLSEGYPHFLQEFAHKAFEKNSDGQISVLDVKEGAFGNNGALSQLGHKFFNLFRLIPRSSASIE